MISKLHYISQGKTAFEHIKSIETALAAGCDWIQLRMKKKSEEEILKTAFEIKRLCNQHQAKLIINDFPLIAKTVNAYGLHLGLLDMHIPEAREIVGQNMIIGGTANTFQDVVKRVTEGADYIGLGPLRYTTTKENLSPVLGLAGYRSIIQKMKEYSYKIPIIAIGGIVKEDISDLIRKGVHGIALSGAITFASNREELVNELQEILEENNKRG